MSVKQIPDPQVLFKPISSEAMSTVVGGTLTKAQLQQIDASLTEYRGALQNEAVALDKYAKNRLRTLKRINSLGD